MATHSEVDHAGITGVPATLATQGFHIGVGVPDNGLGSNGDFYFRRDGTLLASLIYHKAGGVWVSIAVV